MGVKRTWRLHCEHCEMSANDPKRTFRLASQCPSLEVSGCREIGDEGRMLVPFAPFLPLFGLGSAPSHCTIRGVAAN
jgi:hypothetical protein